NARLTDVITICKSADHALDIVCRQNYDDIDVMRGARDAPEVAGNGTGDGVRDSRALHPNDDVFKEFLLQDGTSVVLRVRSARRPNLGVDASLPDERRCGSAHRDEN